MSNLEKILTSREERLFNIKKINNKNVVLSIKANIPGINKNIKESYVLIRIFKKIIMNKYPALNEIFYDSFDGPYCLLEIDTKDVKQFKQAMIELENTHFLGRFIDLDVYDKDRNNLSRQLLHSSKRKCMLCDDDAFICIRKQKHSINELVNKITSSVEEYLILILKDYLKQSLMLELNLHPKFGLVTPFSRGSHLDMDYHLMSQAQEAIIPGLIEMFLIGYNGDDLLSSFNKCRHIGIDIEQEMFIATSGINAYKGVIFIQGLVMISLGYLLKNNLCYDELYNNIIIMSQNLPSELKEKPTTDGLRIYNTYGIGGARKEAYLGLPNVKNAVDYLSSFDELNYEGLIMTLVQIIKSCEDTVMIKRSQTWEKYLYYKQLIASIDKYDYELINNISNKFIADNISCGGSADILITSIFVKLIFDEFID